VILILNTNSNIPQHFRRFLAPNPGAIRLEVVDRNHAWECRLKRIVGPISRQFFGLTLIEQRKKTMEESSMNPYKSPVESASGGDSSAVPDTADLTVVDWLVVVLCSGIGFIIGLLRLAQGKPNAGKMLGMSLLFMLIWLCIRVMLRLASQ
jgi:hypothetical protein